MTIYSVTHVKDIDGMASAALLVKNFDIPVNNVLFFDHSDKAFFEMKKEILSIKPKKSLFIFSDVGLNELLVKKYTRMAAFLKRKGNSIIWLDHHVWSEDSIMALSKYASLMIVGENKFCCGTDIVYKLLCKKDQKSEKLVEFTHISDLYLKPKSKAQLKMLERYAFGITYLNMQKTEIRNAKLRRLIYILSKGDINNSLIRECHSKYTKILRKSLRFLDESVQIIKTKRVKIALGFAPNLQSTFAARRLILKKRAQIGAYVNTEKRSNVSTCSLRSIGKVHCLYIAERFRGGGHPNACSFRVPKRYDVESEKGKRAFIKRFAKLASD
jgi:oligoribonuclease NrnB/cAMP/cGMP phosphodiesterase (DHH superfamily)